MRGGRRSASDRIIVYNAPLKSLGRRFFLLMGGAASRFGFHYEGRSVTRKVKPDVAVRISEEIDKAMTLSGRGLHDAAWEILKRAEAVAQNAQLVSAHLLWGLAAEADARDDAEHAVKYITQALKLDPAAPPFINSHNIIRDRVISTFHAMDVTDVALRPFFEMIAALGAIDAAVLIKLSRHVAEADGNHQAALGLAQDAVQREPQNADALRHLASLLAGAGRHQEARARRSEGDALAVTFSCPAATA